MGNGLRHRYKRLSLNAFDKLRPEVTTGNAWLKPIFNRDGLYYDRLDARCWMEYNGRGYDIKIGSFKHRLEGLSYVPMNAKEAEAAVTLIVFGSCPDELRERWNKDLLYKQARKDGYATKKWAREQLKLNPEWLYRPLYISPVVDFPKDLFIRTVAV